MTMDGIFHSNEVAPNLMGVWERMIIMRSLYINSQEGIASVLALTGTGEILAYEWQPTTWPPSWTLLRQGRHYELVMTGTQHWRQILLHIAGVVGVHETGGGVVCNGEWAYIFRGIWSRARPLILSDAESVTLTGHSYGGGLAICGMVQMGAEIEAGDATVRALTFGSPRALLGQSGWPGQGRIVRVVHQADPVATLPPRTVLAGQVSAPEVRRIFNGVPTYWIHAGVRVLVFGDGTFSVGGLADDSPGFPGVNAVDDFNASHPAYRYLTALTALTRTTNGLT